MAPPSPVVDDDVFGEILLHLSPVDPTLLVCASLVCKSWCRLLTDDAFLRHYRGFHQAPPMISLLRNTEDHIACFVASGSFCPRDRNTVDLLAEWVFSKRIIFWTGEC
ncbi:hypothetical protein ACP70R_048363 [Stipagrostis hirtigluma subsp. patula]